jgi:hypothetical protein
MSGPADLRDRLHKEMLASARAWSSEEIARDVLRIVSDATRAHRLVGAVLGADPRFVREGLSWRVRPPAGAPLDAAAFLLCDLPPAPPGAPAAPLCMQAWEPAGTRTGAILEIGIDGTGLEAAEGVLEGRLPVSATGAAVRRRLHALERAHALPALSERLLDLSALLRLAGEGLPGLLSTPEPASIEERLGATAAALERCLARFGPLSLDEIEVRIEDSAHSQAIDFSPYSFSRNDLDGIPERPGVYRFLGEGGTLLYVGKSRDLRRRIGSYFRPLAADHQRRGRLLGAIRSLEWETVPSELEALLIEAETIRVASPAFNQQLAIRTEAIVGTAADADLAFVLCEGDPDRVSLFLLREGSPWARGRLPRDPVDAAAAAALLCVRAWGIGEPGSAGGLLTPLDADARTLVGRYLRLHRDRTDRLRITDFPDEESAAEGLAALAVRPRPAWDPWSLRAPAC